MSLTCLSCSDVKTLCVMRAKSLFVDKNSGLRIITSILHSSATRDPVAPVVRVSDR